MNALAYLSNHTADLAIEAEQGHPMDAGNGCPRVHAIERAEFLGANKNGRLDDDLFEMLSKRLA